MKLCREEIIRKALRAAAAVTGRATTLAVGVSCAVAVSGCDETTVAQEEDAQVVGVDSSVGDTGTSDVRVEAETREPDAGTEPHTCVVEGGASDWQCCQSFGEAEGCSPCGMDVPVSEQSACVSCATELDPFGEYECCQAHQWSYDMGCMAWGPPAPPEWDGRSLDMLLT